MFENLIHYLLTYTSFIDMFDTLLIITLFLLASLLVCLLTLRLSINIKHACLFFHSLPILTDILNFRPPHVDFDPSPLQFIEFNKDRSPTHLFIFSRLYSDRFISSTRLFFICLKIFVMLWKKQLRKIKKNE